MKLHRFYIRDGVGRKTQVVVHLPVFLNQLQNVLRLKVGDKVILFDDSGLDFLAKIEMYTKDSVTLQILELQDNKVKPSRETWLFCSVIKKDKFEWIVEKATELGVSRIIPLTTGRTEKKDLNHERLLKIAIEASEQSGRATVPMIHEVTKVSTALDLIKENNLLTIVCHTQGEKFDRSLLTTGSTSGVAIWIGPEGGWTDSELGLFAENNLLIRNLGPQVLRAETAVVAALSQVVF